MNLFMAIVAAEPSRRATVFAVCQYGAQAFPGARRAGLAPLTDRRPGPRGLQGDSLRAKHTDWGHRRSGYTLTGHSHLVEQ